MVVATDDHRNAPRSDSNLPIGSSIFAPGESRPLVSFFSGGEAQIGKSFRRWRTRLGFVRSEAQWLHEILKEDFAGIILDLVRIPTFVLGIL